MERGPDVNSYSSSWEISYSVSSERGFARSSVILASDMVKVSEEELDDCVECCCVVVRLELKENWDWYLVGSFGCLAIASCDEGSSSNEPRPRFFPRSLPPRIYHLSPSLLLLLLSLFRVINT